MAGVTSYPFRLLCHEAGVGLVCTEMISSQALIRNHGKTREMIQIHPQERPVSIQLFGADPQVMAEAARIASEQANLLDINMGCGVPKVVKTGAGAALMAQPELAEQIVQAVVSAATVPVTVKMRKGYREDQPTAGELARRAQDAGATGVTIHPRIAGASYAHPADWSFIAQIKRQLSIPVIGNGDVRTPHDAQRMMDETGCDGVMIGRAALGNPFVFTQVRHFLRTGELLPPATLDQRIEAARQHGRMLIEQRGEVVALRQMRTHLGHYLRGFREAPEVRAKVHQLQSWEEVEDLLAQLQAQGQREAMAA